ncbi:hypothetical protein [Rhizomicrobium electricum]|jgi:hypothetical protein|uniref:Uncharacterized protein n=1 Tax=Rhizomicrobium electricum TaxID=480070 RepID=A0ABN1EK06_9PROT|nr:hypothetical protein [Rhizomicrobium electricum]NIJ47150.1 hypothetical protein [Rhizomicrobium electricum]
MKLRAQFVVDVTATDYVQAADHQKRLGAFLEEIKRQYTDATLTIRERRKPKLVRRPREEDSLAISE